MFKSVLSIAAAVACLTGTANAQAVSEAGDAGELLGTAQIINTGVTSISGTLTNLGTGSDVDDIDLYRFFISDPDMFSVTVSSNLSVDNDSQLFVFNALGQLVASDDDGGPGLFAQIDAGELSGQAAGNYFLAFNLFNTDPILTGGVFTGWNRSPAPFQVGDYTLTITGANGAVPEPATWAMMIVGVGAVGGALRRRSKVATSVKFA